MAIWSTMMQMTDYFAATVWAIVAAVFLANAIYAWLLADYNHDPLPAALGWMFLCLFIGTGLIGFLRTDYHEIIPINVLKIIERSAFIVSALNGLFVIQMLGKRAEQPRLIDRVLQRWNHMLAKEQK